ncbi:Tumor necrosis factor alpha-induced protein 8-like protein 1 [Clonorchis sinensis]|uniref:Tumor necrosis factor alpha-induced protein 8-like protein 2 n=2 Tax=Clonorchis sinensis TaxID=79923 RepID=H2KSE9_CLOSI|nr:Tumor necrosis factor alpha-induced protein 8-like protein 1 [Clonorchis sinensis]GAA32761.1 tumor necrosis factor alpha-induced protein 8-like protein 2 [Clonorchis sinensis]
MASKAKPDESSEGNSDDTVEHFNVRAIALRMQSQMVGNVPSGILRLFLDEASVRLFTNICKLLRLYTGSNKTAVAYTKRIVKMNIRLTAFSTADVLNDEEDDMACDFHDRCHLAAEILLRLGRPKRRLLPGVTPTIDKLVDAIQSAKSLALKITERHLKQTTRDKFREAVDFFLNPQFFTTVFSEQECYKGLLEDIYDSIEDLIDRGLF